MRLSLLEKVNAQSAAAQERKRLIEQLQESLRVRDEFLAIASHELRTPLTPLWLHFRLIQKVLPELKLEQFPEVARIFKSFDVYKEQLSRLTTLAENLLDISKIQSGAFELNLQDQVDLGAIISKVSGQFLAPMEKAGCHLNVEIKDDSLRVRADPERIAQVVGNLLSNAAKYGSGKPVEVTMYREADWAKVTVQDHGMGIRLADQKRIFGRFERASSYRSFGGLGLGLFISNEIIRRHGGSIHVKSSPGEGALFSIWLPLTL